MWGLGGENRLGVSCISHIDGNSGISLHFFRLTAKFLYLRSSGNGLPSLPLSWIYENSECLAFFMARGHPHILTLLTSEFNGESIKVNGILLHLRF